MNVLLRRVTLLDPTAEAARTVDVHYRDGAVQRISEEPFDAPEAATVTDATDLVLAPAFTDIGTQVREPGLEQHEDLESAAAAAIAGGYGALAPFPNTDPVVDGKAGVRYLRRSAAELSVMLYPIGALSKGTSGELPAELFDLYRQGVRLFSDGPETRPDDGNLLRALQYTQAFGGTVCVPAMSRPAAGEGLMHEGPVSTSLGLRGLAGAQERMAVQRALELLRYAGGQLHLYAISSAASVTLVREAKAEGLAVSASVAALNLLLTDEELRGFDSAYKVLPPLRAESDRTALIDGLADGTIDAVVSNHAPWDAEHKNLELPYAAFGVPALETAFAAARTATQDTVPLPVLLRALTAGPRAILQQESIAIAPDYQGALVLLDPEVAWTVSAGDLHSKGFHNPLLGRTLSGRVARVFR